MVQRARSPPLGSGPRTSQGLLRGWAAQCLWQDNHTGTQLCGYEVSAQGLHLPGVCQLLGTHWSTQRCQNLTPVKTRQHAISGSRGTQGLSLPTFPPAFPSFKGAPGRESGYFFHLQMRKLEAQERPMDLPR